MRINTNVAALNSYNQLKDTQNNLSKSLERLSSGKRINSAADDAAGLAISEKMNAQINGLSQAQRNAQDGISMIQTAEGALKESHSILQRMRELSVQAANDTNTAADREEIQKEVDQLTSELDRIASDTEFNTQKLLNGSKSVDATMTANTTNLSSVDAETSVESGTYNVATSNVSTATTNFSANGTGIAKADITAGTAASTNVDAGNYQIQISDVDSAASTADVSLLDSEGNVLDSVNDVTTTGSGSAALGGFTVATSGVSAAGTANFTQDITADITVTEDSGATGEEVAKNVSVKASYASGADKTSEFSVGDFTFEATSNAVAGTGSNDDFSVQNKAVTLQIGANEEQNTKASMNDMSSEALGVKSVDLTTQEGADNAIATIDKAIADVSAERSKLGAVQNRLDHTINNLNTSQENLTAAESRISDVDMAKEMMNLTKQQILSQAGTAMLAQANQMPQGVLQLLG
jgi:flagellin